ncbi:MAG: hypothetical protein ACTSRC_20915 [Candidatus Helarchaeota archaeon]
MTNTLVTDKIFIKRHFIGVFLSLTILLSLFLPMVLVPSRNDEPAPIITLPVVEDFTLPSLDLPNIADEPNFTRESWPFVLNNYPDFHWKNPGCFDGTQTSNGPDTPGTIVHTPTGPSRGYNPDLPAPGTGLPAYPVIYDALEGLNESNIRIMYLDVNYEWKSVPYQIDQKGWTNIWQIADLNKWGGLQDHSNTGSEWNEHVIADSTVGLGFIAGDMITSEGLADYGGVSNDLYWDWYRIPYWTYLSPYQADGTVTDETLHIDPEYRDHLIWCYMANTSRPHMAWLAGDSGGSNGVVNVWNQASGAPDSENRNNNPVYANITVNGWKPAFVNCTTLTDPWVDAYGNTNVVFMGDTWFRTPGNYSSNPQWVCDAFPYQQINGALDKDDELCFYVYPGRKAAADNWWNYTFFPSRFELQIIDPVDGGQTWMYIYFNNETWADPFHGGINLGMPIFDVKDKNGAAIKDYLSWDPDTYTISTDYYQVSLNETNPSIIDSVRILGKSDNRPILTAFNKKYQYERIEESFYYQWAREYSIGKEGPWYSWSTGAISTYSEVITTLENPSVYYPGIPGELGQTIPYFSGGETGDRRDYSVAPQCPQNYRGPEGMVRHPTNHPFTEWEAQFGDGRVVIDGTCRIIIYLQQFLLTGMYLNLETSSYTIFDDYIDIAIPLTDGPSVYYRRMQIAPEIETRTISLQGFRIQTYYTYFMGGNINPDVRVDINLTAATEWVGTPDGIDDNIPKFGWEGNETAPVYGWYKQGGLDPKMSNCTILGFSQFDGISNDYYGSQGNPLIEKAPDVNGVVCPPDGNNLNVPDWVMLTSETHGGIWIYMPRREIMEIKDNNEFNYNAEYGTGGTHGAGYYGQPKFYFRDDQYAAEFGICLDGGQSPWLQMGAETSKYHMLIVYDDFADADAIPKGHKLYLNYWFPLENECAFNFQQPPTNQFYFDKVLPDKLIYRTGDTITLDVTGAPENTVINASFTDIDLSDPIVPMINNTLGEWFINYTIDTVDGVATDYERKIILTADCLLPMYVTDSNYTITIIIDNIAPKAANFSKLPTTTSEASVLLDWSANPGSDVGCASMANPSGLGKYRIRRGIKPGVYNTIIADELPNTQTQFLDSFIQNGITYYYILDTYDEAGNMATSVEVNTTINLPYTPAQPNDLTPSSNPPFTIDWTENPGFSSGVVITGYQIYWASSTDGSFPAPYTYNLAPNGDVGLQTTYTLSPNLTEATYTFFKILTLTTGVDLYSVPVYTRIDTIAPTPAELATPLPIYNAEKEEIIVSWAIDTLSQYQTGGFPGHDLNGIDHWIVFKKSGTSPWEELAEVPFTSNPAGQRIRDISVSDGEIYSYSILTVDGAGNSALCAYNKTTTLNVVGFGIAEVYSVEAATLQITQGQRDLTISVLVRNPGATNVTLNELQLYFHKGDINVTADYSGVRLVSESALNAGQNATYIFSVDVSETAIIGDISIEAQTLYNTTKVSVGALYPASWLVTPDASLNIQTIVSDHYTVHPGEQDIPVTIQIKNPGSTNVILSSIRLKFMRDGTDISNKFLVEQITALPFGPFTDTISVTLNVTISQGITLGGVIVDTILSGSAIGVSLSDNDGAITPLTWAVVTWPKPVIASVKANKKVFWPSPIFDIIELTIICDKGGHTVKGYFGNVQFGAGNMTASNPYNGTSYTITFTLTSPVGEGFYDVLIYAENALRTSTKIIRIHLAQAPTFESCVQNPADGAVDPNEIVYINVTIRDNEGDDNIDAHLKYRVDGGSWTNRIMNYTGNGNWDVTIPEQVEGAYIDYIIFASDAQGNEATYSQGYTVNFLQLEPFLIMGSESIHAPGDPGTVYNETPGFGAPQDTPIAYSVTINTSLLVTPMFYVVLISAFDPVRNTFIDVNESVWMESPILVNVTLELTYENSTISSGTLITGKIFILTDLLSKNGRTISVLSFVHLVE